MGEMIHIYNTKIVHSYDRGDEIVQRLPNGKPCHYPKLYPPVGMATVPGSLCARLVATSKGSMKRPGYGFMKIVNVHAGP